MLGQRLVLKRFFIDRVAFVDVASDTNKLLAAFSCRERNASKDFRGAKRSVQLADVVIVMD